MENDHDPWAWPTPSSPNLSAYTSGPAVLLPVHSIVLALQTDCTSLHADLVRAIEPCPRGTQVDFIRASSYGSGTESSGVVKLGGAVDVETIRGRDVLLVGMQMAGVHWDGDGGGQKVGGFGMQGRSCGTISSVVVSGIITQYVYLYARYVYLPYMLGAYDHAWLFGL